MREYEYVCRKVSNSKFTKEFFNRIKNIYSKLTQKAEVSYEIEIKKFHVYDCTYFATHRLREREW